MVVIVVDWNRINDVKVVVVVVEVAGGSGWKRRSGGSSWNRGKVKGSSGDVWLLGYCCSGGSLYSGWNGCSVSNGGRCGSSSVNRRNGDGGSGDIRLLGGSVELVVVVVVMVILVVL
ncbi:hypothetical protein Pcinc_019722 [Petrolisthes cinctipes]|uniref:Transmembrane protein n=1 Tax=Petrolisthes cinctipes TaxID=88211 RepID=A0AAE1FJJ9_PETCI|nr:hypothetical protein Pcinc_019722 [Petrolisthes cinctipes]